MARHRPPATLRDLGTVPTTMREEQGFLDASARHLAANQRSMAFTAVYLFDDRDAARLITTTGLRAGHPAAPELIEAADPAPLWPAAAILAREPGVVIDGIDERFEGLPTGAWTVPPRQALVAALPDPWGGRPFGFVVVGADRFRPLDDDYEAFIGRIAQRLAAGVGSAACLRGRASPRRAAGRARPRQDGVLLQRQPRVPDAAHAHARAAPRRARGRGGATAAGSPCA